MKVALLLTASTHASRVTLLWPRSAIVDLDPTVLPIRFVSAWVLVLLKLVYCPRLCLRLRPRLHLRLRLRLRCRGRVTTI